MTGKGLKKEGVLGHILLLKGGGVSDIIMIYFFE
jgi:hypothetical protein